MPRPWFLPFLLLGSPVRDISFLLREIFDTYKGVFKQVGDNGGKFTVVDRQFFRNVIIQIYADAQGGRPVHGIADDGVENHVIAVLGDFIFIGNFVDISS